MRILRPVRSRAGRIAFSARIAPSHTAAASSKGMPAGIGARAPPARIQMNSACAPNFHGLIPKTWSPTLNSVTAVPTGLDDSGQVAAEDLSPRPAETADESGRRTARLPAARSGSADRRRVDLDQDLVALGKGSLGRLRVAGRPAGPYLSRTTALTMLPPCSLQHQATSRSPSRPSGGDEIQPELEALRAVVAGLERVLEDHLGDAGNLSAGSPRRMSSASAALSSGV